MAVAALPFVAAGFAALILAFAAVALYRPLIVGTLGQLPVVGGWVQSQINNLILSAVAAAANWVDSAVGPLTQLLRAGYPVLNSVRFWNGEALQLAWLNLYDVVLVRLPAYLAASYNYTGQVLQAAYAYANEVLQAAYSYSSQVLQAAYAYANEVLQAAYAYANEVLQAAYAYAYGLAVQVEQLAYQLVIAEQTRALAAELALAQYTVALAERDLAWTVEAVRGAELYAQELAIAAEGYARQLVDLEASQRVAQGEALATAAAAATAAVAARVGAIEDSPCQTYCSPLGELGQLLQGLEDAGLTALLLALIGEARTHPDQVVSALREGVQVPVQDAWSSLGLEAGRS